MVLPAAEARSLQIHPRESFPTAVSLHGAFTEDTRIRILPWLLFSPGLLQHLQLNVRCLKHSLSFHENVIHVYSSYESVLVTLQWDAPGILINACHVEFSDVLVQERLGARLQCLALPWFFTFSLPCLVSSALFYGLSIFHHIFISFLYLKKNNTHLSMHKQQQQHQKPFI